ncbi:serine hydrolase [Carnobacteriaceae bacterium zg-C25]|nr:serine hydrolase [Carnobacteriaceae bacterium zg-C25]
MKKIVKPMLMLFGFLVMFGLANQPLASELLGQTSTVNAANNTQAELVYVNNRWEYHVGGKIDPQFTAVVSHKGTDFYVQNGVINWGYTGLAQRTDKTWVYVEKGVTNYSQTLLVDYYNSKFYVQKGKVDWTFTNLFKHEGEWYFVQYGRVNTDFVGLFKFNGLFFFVRNGKVDWNYKGLHQHTDGTWYLIEKGIIATDQTKLVPYQNNLFYVQNGKIDWTFTNLFKHEGEWYFVQYGRVDTNFVGLFKFNGLFFFVRNGKVDWNYKGLHQHTDGTWYLIEKGIIAEDQNRLVLYQNNWFYVQKGKIDWSYTGLVNHEGVWYHVVSARLDRNFTGLTNYLGNLFYVENGLLNWGYTGLAQEDVNWRYVKKGVVDKAYSGVVLYQGRLFYVHKGNLDWTFNGDVTFEGIKYTVKHNAVEWPAEGFVIVSDINTKNYAFTITLKPNLVNNIKSVKSYVWSEKNGQDDIVENRLFKQKDGTYKSVIRFANYGYVPGRYLIDTYITLNSGQEILVSKKDITLNLPPQRAKVAQDIANLKATYHRLFDSVGGRRSAYVTVPDGIENFAINQNSTNPAASTIKIFVMASVFNKAARGEFDFSWRYTVQSSDIVTGSSITEQNIGVSFNMDQYIRFMMEKSDNAATNILIRHLGGIQATNDEIRRLGYTKTVLTRYMWDRAAINQGLDNYVSAQEASDLIKNIYNGQLVFGWYDAAMLDRLSRNYYAEWLTANIRGYTKTWDKPGGGIGTGTDNDIAVIERNGRAIVVSVFNYFGAGHQKNAVIQYGVEIAKALAN